MELTLTPEQKAAFPRPSRKLETVYDVITEAARIMRQEPKRYNQAVWMKMEGGSFFDDHAYPMCGTIACRAGWIASVFIGATAGRAMFEVLAEELQKGELCIPGYRMAEIAEYVLGYYDSNRPNDLAASTDALFSEKALEKENGEYDGEYDEYVYSDMPERGSRQYAELGAEGLEEYRDRFATWFRSRKVADLELAKKFAEAGK